MLSSDYFRGVVADQESDQSATQDAFDILHFIAAKRLAAGRLTVIDATNVQASARRSLLKLAKEHHVLTVAIVFDLPARLCHERNRERPDRDFGHHVIRRQVRFLKQSLPHLRREGFHRIHVLTSPAEVDQATIERQKLWNDRRDEHGPFDIIGDVHGCCDELEILLDKLGYIWEEIQAHVDPAATAAGSPSAHYKRLYRHPEGRKAIFLGDIVDRGPRILDSYELVRNMVAAGHALCVAGNHDWKLVRKLRGRDVQIKHGLAQSLAEIEGLPEQYLDVYAKDMAEFFSSLIGHYVMDDGKLVVAHAGMKESLQGRASARVRDFSLYGETTGETDEFGLPVRHNWAAEYRGRARVVYGHTPVVEAEWLNRTINIDTGCVFGGKLSALRYPELDLVSVAARRTYAEPVRPLTAPERRSLTAQQQHDDLLDIEDISGRRRIRTRLRNTITINEENGIAALEVLSRFAVNPKWLIYLPPTMAPTPTSDKPGYLEHPEELFKDLRKAGVRKAICEEKHMGSRAIVIICRDEDAALRRFGVEGEGIGICYTRTGRRFFDDPHLEGQILKQIADSLTATGFWDKLDTSWVCLDCELMPWSVKAEELVRQQYAAVGAAANAALSAATQALEHAEGREAGTGALFKRYTTQANHANQFREAYRRYCWQVKTASDIKMAPFHVLATEGAVHTGKSHLWHMETITRFLPSTDHTCLTRTRYQLVDLTTTESQTEATAWWAMLTREGGEGFVVKPFDFISRGPRGLIQPAVKCRGREYLRLIYGPDYTLPENLNRLRRRGLSRKRSLAIREFALGIEALERFVARQPLRRVHECVFGVLALESEAVDPRL